MKRFTAFSKPEPIRNLARAPGSKRLHSRKASGFTLLEIMVCLSIISIVLVAVYRLHSQTLIMNLSSRFFTTAPLLAQRKLTEVEMRGVYDLADGSGDFGPEYTGYTWRLSVEDAVAPVPDATAENLKKIDLTVSFNQDELTYSLRAYRYPTP